MCFQWVVGSLRFFNQIFRVLFLKTLKTQRGFFCLKFSRTKRDFFPMTQQQLSIAKVHRGDGYQKPSQIKAEFRECSPLNGGQTDYSH